MHQAKVFVVKQVFSFFGAVDSNLISFKLQAQIRNVLHIWILLFLFVNDELQPGGDLSPPNYNPLLAQSLKSRK